jgi:hypothetical protein
MLFVRMVAIWQQKIIIYHLKNNTWGVSRSVTNEPKENSSCPQTVF